MVFCGEHGKDPNWQPHWITWIRCMLNSAFGSQFPFFSLYDYFEVVATDDGKVAECCRGFGADAAPDAVFSTAVTSLKPEDAFDPNRVKCVVDNRGQERLIHSFHICFILEFSVLLLGQSYDSKFLKIYPQLQPTPLQLEEDLEQFKVLENVHKMKLFFSVAIKTFSWLKYKTPKVEPYVFLQVIKVDHEAHGVDTAEDVEKTEAFMCEKNLS
ncbi:hypothetical protein Patl1_04647 [Pistacia atlantica]|uniref:Uncharacterized protein n=1 Tax=Pistacia atlantica TaxID=434234 RepID=A0ACC1BWQ5_9ROSI|nr:hypothetical protein Patl1_04647 [Pistacia atlantica]